MATTTISGLATGLDSTSIIQGLLAVDQQRITDLQTSEATVTQDQTAFQGIDANLVALQSATTALSQTQNSVFDALNVASSDSTQITAAASSNAVPGNYLIQVNHLAQAEETASQGFNSATAAITEGTLQLQVGSASTTITIDGTNNTLQGLANAINNSGAAVTASVVNDGSPSGSGSYRLLLISDQTGTDNAITLTNSLADDNGTASKPVFDATYIGSAVTSSGYTGTSTPVANSGAGGYTGSSNNTYQFTVVNGGTVGSDSITLSYTDSTGADTGTITLNSGDAGVFKSVAQGVQVQFGAGTLIAGQTFSVNAYVPDVQQAANASVTLGSGAGALTVQSDSNTLNDVINGVTLSLTGAKSSQPVTLAVTNNTEQANTAITNFVTAYNAVFQSIDSQSTFNATTKTAGLLLGNANASSIEQQVRNAVSNAVTGINPLLNNLGALGITAGSNDQLTVNQTQLNAVLSGQVSGVSLKDVQNLFAAAGSSSISTSTGLATQLNTVLTSLLDPVSGLLTTVDAGYTQETTNLQQDITQQTTIMNDKQQSLETQFAALEATVSQLKTIGQYLSTQFSSTSSSSQPSVPQPTLITGANSSSGSSGSSTSSSTSSSN